MIIVARRPTCLPAAKGLQPWEVGTVCHVARVGIALAVISLVASCILFGVLAVVRRPFEAHLFSHGYTVQTNPFATPSASRGASPIRPSARTLNKRPSRRRTSTSTRRSRSNSDIESIDLSHSPAPPTICNPSPQRSVGLGIFTSEFTPPPIPGQFIHPVRSTSLDSLTPLFPPSPSQRVLTRPPRLSGNKTNTVFIPLTLAPQYSASTLRALHPPSPSGVLHTSQSHPHLPSTVFSDRSRLSPSSASLIRPQRLGTVVRHDGQSPRSVSIGAGRRGPLTCCSEDFRGKTLGEEIASALMQGTCTPDVRYKARGKGDKRTSSAPDVAAGAQESPQKDCMTIGWKPLLTDSLEDRNLDQAMPDVTCASIKLTKVVRASSAELLSRFSPDTSPDDDETTPRRQLERNFDLRARVMKELPFRRSRSVGPTSRSDVDVGVQRSSIVEAAAAMVSNMPQDLIPKTRMRSRPERKKTMMWDDWRNKPLPRIAKL
ncbi:hypothetical protein ACEQ8H_004688 [Pleosporales sp. CAS-2024a]